MPSKFDKNFTKDGYLMKYIKGETYGFYNKCVLQFKIELNEIDPLIWRRIQIPTDYNLWDLHVAIQDSMGWLDYHLHHFEFKGRGKDKKVHIGIPDFDGVDDTFELFPAWEIPVMHYFKDLGLTAKYLYDYGDSWEHTVRLEGYMFKEKSVKYPICIDGARACPPEDCGGVDRYQELLETLADTSSENHEQLKLWVGSEWNSEKFDSSAIKFDNPNKRWKKSFLSKR
jgi:hypothetical protein